MTIRDLFIQRCNTAHNIDKHLPTLLGYATMVDSVVELGTDIGFSTTAFLAGGVKRLDCYDIEITDWAVRLKRMADLTGTCMVVHQESTLSAVIPDCDLLFIDTVHTYGQVLSELQRHAVKAARFVILHDIVSCPEIVPAIHNYMSRHPEWGLREWSSIQSGLAVYERATNG